MKAKFINEDVDDIFKPKTNKDVGLAFKGKRLKRANVHKFFEWVRDIIEEEVDDGGNEFFTVLGEDMEDELIRDGVMDGYKEFVENWQEYENDCKDLFGLDFPELPQFEETQFDLI